MNAELERLAADTARRENWKRWGPYLSERQWGTVREDYSPGGNSWDYVSHDDARSRAYRWGEDGLLGITDRECRLCFALALWNGKDPILKERLFGLTGPEGNHGEDVKELYYYLDATPTSSYLKALYKYPQAAFPYAQLVEENRRRSKLEPEFELIDTGVFTDNRYFDVTAEYAKSAPDDIFIRLTLANRGPDPATLHVLPQLWFRNLWSWGKTFEYETTSERPRLFQTSAGGPIEASHPTLGRYRLTAGPGPGGQVPEALFTENETNAARLYGIQASRANYSKDAFHRYTINRELGAVAPVKEGTKVTFPYVLDLAAGTSIQLRLRLCAEERPAELFAQSDQVFAERIAEADAFYAGRISPRLSEDERRVARQAYAGLLWSKQFYHYVIESWLEGDPAQPKPPDQRLRGRNHEWQHLFARDVLSLPDKWEYPWFAAWDLAFHMLPMARLDPAFAKEQLLLLLREWYMHPNGQIPAYEFNLSDVNPPVHAWAAWRVYKISAERGERDLDFLERVFQKLLLNFTWWVNRKDAYGKNLFSGGFLGLDNIGVFDRSGPAPLGGELEQADSTAWMAFYCGVMLSMAIRLAQTRPAYEDIASKFFEHYVAIIDAINSVGGEGLWDDEDGFYYDCLRWPSGQKALKTRSIVGVIPLFAVEILREVDVQKLPGFRKRLLWFLANKPKMGAHLIMRRSSDPHYQHVALLATPPLDRLKRVLRYVLDENEFLSEYGVRAVSRYHRDHPFEFRADGQTLSVRYVPGESDSSLFGGNSNWRGPIWFPVNYLLIEALQRYHLFYGDTLKVECPTGSGRWMNLLEVSRELARRLSAIFLKDAQGRRPVHGQTEQYANDPAWQDLILFYEYLHGDTGRGLGASHQTGWTALVARLLEERARR
ncbi:MAG: glucosidase [Verrucomicrobia bacterium]|nr:glucosidase [Verrucomicrobiota bacterium]